MAGQSQYECLNVGAGALGAGELPGDANHDGQITVDAILDAVNHALTNHPGSTP